MRIQLGIPMPLSEIAYAAGGRLINTENPLIKFVTTDSREVEYDDLFIAIKGEKFDGENFVEAVKKKGGIVLSSHLKFSDIFHLDGRSALLSFAAYYNKNLPYILYRIGITGSVGKTTTKEFLKALLSKSYVTHSSEGNYNNEIGMPMSILSAKRDNQILISEMGMNHPGEISRMSKCLRPNISIITNVGTAHIGNLGSRINIAKAKLEIIDGMNGGLLIVPDDESLLKNAKNLVTFSLNNERSSYYLCSEGDGYVSIYKDGKQYTKACFNFMEEHHKKCLLAAASAAMEIGISANQLSSGISAICGDNIRQRVFYREKYLFYADYYNASKESVLACIKTAKNNYPRVQKSLLLGDILELGDMSEDIHFSIGKAILPDIFQNIFLFGNYVDSVRSGAISVGFPAERIFLNRDLYAPQVSAEQIRNNCHPNEMIFMKASRAIQLERVLYCFQE